jgi:hypothetical protein
MRAMMAMAGAAGLSCAAAGQDVVVFGHSTETRAVEAACFRVFGDDCPRVFSARHLVERLDAGVTLALIEYYFDLAQEDKELLLPALERHIDGGGRLLLAYTELDEWTELQELVGVRTVGDVTSIFATDTSVQRIRLTWYGAPNDVRKLHARRARSTIRTTATFSKSRPMATSLAYMARTYEAAEPAMALTRSGAHNRKRLSTSTPSKVGAIDRDGSQDQLLWLLQCHA